MSSQETLSKVVITLPDGKTIEFDHAPTGREVAEAIGPGLAKAALAIQVNGEARDLNAPIAEDSEVAILTARQPEGLEVLRHSCTHLMAQAVKRLWPDAMLEDGPPTDEGYFYDIRMLPPATTEDFPRIEAEMEKIVKENLPIERSELSREEAIELFQKRGEKYKVHILQAIPEGDTISVYQQGEFIDLCRGPHVPSTGVFQAFKLLTTAGAYWKGDARNDQLTRIRGTAFANKKELKQYINFLEEARKRDHRRIGRELGLFMHHEWTPGETIWLPKGKILYDVLKNMSTELHVREGYDEVFTPMLFRKDLFECSGHWKHFRDDMFIVPGQEHHILDDAEIAEWAEKLEAEAREDEKDWARIEPHLEGKSAPGERLSVMLDKSAVFKDRYWNLFEKRAGIFVTLRSQEGDIYALKPMNCPSHMLIFRDRRRSYRELPLRISDQGVLHRNEPSGTLSGLTRVRQFCQDDAHIFVEEEQIAEEIKRVIGMVRAVYGTFEMEFAHVFLSTRPEKAMGTKEQWDHAEAALKEAIEANGLDYTVNEGDGAFYGPKIDFIVRDVLRREHQVATIQLDYQLPARFELHYTAADGSEKTPVVVHRALYGSFERFMGMMIEHYAGAFPVWLAPEQVRVLTISEKYLDYGREVYDILRKEGVRAQGDWRDDKIGAKIRDARMDKVPYMLIVGEQEEANRAVAVRSRKGDEGSTPLQEFLDRINSEKQKLFESQ
ncbi:threonine--tRNA ligase [bacterium]|nr:threonine--tRNA ligase [bacterium]